VTTAVGVQPLIVTGCGVVSPVGLGLDRLGEALRTRQVSYADPTADPLGEYPPEVLWAVPDVLAEHLGRKGMRNVDRLTSFGLVACKLALEQAGLAASPGNSAASAEDQASIGVVMATSTGSMQSCAEVARDTVLQDRPYLVHPGRFPNVVMNSCAGQIAIFNSLKGVNATVAGGQVSSLAALRYARSAIRAGRATRLLVGGVEELCPPLAWGWHLSDALMDQAPIGEGCAVFMVEDGESARLAGRVPLAEFLACEVGYYGGATQRRALADGMTTCIDRALERSGVTPDEVDVVSLGAANHVGLDGVERRAVQRVLGRAPAQLRIADVLGECYSASGVMQIAALLAQWRQDPAEVGRTALVTSAGNDGNVGCLVVRESVARGI
jgi:3-oxoacyl-[acyl-carrier-protein] synthase II